MLVFFKAGVVQFRKNIKNQGKKKVEKTSGEAEWP